MADTAEDMADTAKDTAEDMEDMEDMAKNMDTEKAITAMNRRKQKKTQALIHTVNFINNFLKKFFLSFNTTLIFYFYLFMTFKVSFNLYFNTLLSIFCRQWVWWI